MQSSKMSAHSQTPVMLARVLIGLHDVLDRMMIAEFKEDEVQTKTLKVKKAHIRRQWLQWTVCSVFPHCFADYCLLSCSVCMEVVVWSQKQTCGNKA